MKWGKGWGEVGEGITIQYVWEHLILYLTNSSFCILKALQILAIKKYMYLALFKPFDSETFFLLTASGSGGFSLLQTGI